MPVRSRSSHRVSRARYQWRQDHQSLPCHQDPVLQCQPELLGASPPCRPALGWLGWLWVGVRPLPLCPGRFRDLLDGLEGRLAGRGVRLAGRFAGTLLRARVGVLVRAARWWRLAASVRPMRRPSTTTEVCCRRASAMKSIKATSVPPVHALKGESGGSGWILKRASHCARGISTSVKPNIGLAGVRFARLANREALCTSSL